jgi:hypothetical protein
MTIEYKKYSGDIYIHPDLEVVSIDGVLIVIAPNNPPEPSIAVTYIEGKLR